MPSTSDNSGMLLAAEVISKVDIREPPERESSALGSQRWRRQPSPDLFDLNAKLIKVCIISIWQCANHHIDAEALRNDANSYEFTYSAPQKVPFSNLMAVLRNNHSNSAIREQGGRRASFQMLGPQQLPCSFNHFKLAFPGQPIPPGIRRLPTRRRIYSEDEPLVAFALSYDDDPTPRVPIASPFARENRASSHGVCFGDGTLAYP